MVAECGRLIMGSSIDLTRMECKGITPAIELRKIFGIDLTRMECKAQNIALLIHPLNCIDLTRMECKVII